MDSRSPRAGPLAPLSSQLSLEASNPLGSQGYELDQAPSIRASLLIPPGLLPLVSIYLKLSLTHNDVSFSLH